MVQLLLPLMFSYWLIVCRVAGEIVPNSRTDAVYPRQHHWTWLSSTRATLHLDCSKTDPFRRGVDIKYAASGSSTCPLAAMSALERLTPVDPQAPLLMMDDGSPLTRPTLMRRVQRALTSAGYNAGSYSGHSFRRGGAQSLAEAHVPDHVIKAMGRWESWCYQLYVDITPQQIAEYSTAIGRLPASRVTD